MPLTQAEQLEWIGIGNRLTVLKRRLAPLWNRRRELRQQLARTYPHEVHDDMRGYPEVYVTQWSPCTHERTLLRAALDMANKDLSVERPEYEWLKKLDEMYRRLAAEKFRKKRG